MPKPKRAAEMRVIKAMERILSLFDFLLSNWLLSWISDIEGLVVICSCSCVVVDVDDAKMDRPKRGSTGLFVFCRIAQMT